jgi:hypothetical protein
MSEPKPSEQNSAEQGAPAEKPAEGGPSGTGASQAIIAALKAFWGNFPVILTAVGGLIAATATLVGALDKAALLRRATVSPGVTVTAIVTQATERTPTLAPTVAMVPTTTPTPVPSATPMPPTPTGAPALPEGALLMDDFADPGTGWDVQSTNQYELAYKDGGYHILVRDTKLTVWGNPARPYEFQDLVIEVDAKPVGGPVDNEYGVLVRYKPDVGFYLFTISSDGMYSVKVSEGEGWRDLVKWSQSSAIHQNLEPNHIRVECLGSRMRFYVNGKLLAETADSAFPSGNIGLLVGTYDEGNVEVRFDNVLVQVLKRF